VIGLFALVFTVIAGVASIQSAWFPHLLDKPSPQAPPPVHIPSAAKIEPKLPPLKEPPTPTAKEIAGELAKAQAKTQAVAQRAYVNIKHMEVERLPDQVWPDRVINGQFVPKNTEVAFKVRLVLSNIGQTAAQHLTIDSYFGYVTRGDAVELPKLFYAEAAREGKTAFRAIAPSQTEEEQHTLYFGLPQENQNLVSVITVRYEDVFGGHHQTQECLADWANHVLFRDPGTRTMSGGCAAIFRVTTSTF
jgi:hypothetical protein